MMEIERRKTIKLDDETIDEISERVSNKILDPLTDKVSEKLEDRFFQNAGRLFVEKVLYLLGVLSVGALFWLNTKGLLKF